MCDDTCTVGWCGSGGFCYCCFSTKTTICVISFVSLLATAADARFDECCVCFCDARDQIRTLRLVMRGLFQVANVILLIACMLDNTSLIQIYVWYTLGFLTLGFAVTLAETLLCYRAASPTRRKWCLLNFLTEVAFLFVLSRCLPLVDMYRKELIDASHCSTDPC